MYAGVALLIIAAVLELLSPLLAVQPGAGVRLHLNVTHINERTNGIM